MSVTVSLLPSALALRIVMGRERFEAWAASLRVAVGTCFTEEADLLWALAQAGVEAEPLGPYFVTRLEAEGRDSFVWERVQGRWTAVFSMVHERAQVERLMARVEAGCGRKVFDPLPAEPVDADAAFARAVQGEVVPVRTKWRGVMEVYRALYRCGIPATSRDDRVVETSLGAGDGLAVQTLRFEKEGETWVAKFPAAMGRGQVMTCIAQIEEVCGGAVFEDIPGGSRAVKAGPKQYPTNFRDGQMLLATLEDFGARPERKADGAIECRIERTRLRFVQPDVDSAFVVEVENAPSLAEVYRYMQDLDEDYRRCVQSVVYEKVKARAAASNLELEQEEVLPDNTIVMTLRVN